MHRMRRVLAAIRMAEMAALGAQISRAGAARDAAAAHRATARQGCPGATIAEMATRSAWQAHQEIQARRAEAVAAEAEAAAVPMRADLARTIGRESVAEGLIRRATNEAAALAERRAEGMTPVSRPAGPIMAPPRSPG